MSTMAYIDYITGKHLLHNIRILCGSKNILNENMYSILLLSPKLPLPNHFEILLVRASRFA